MERAKRAEGPSTEISVRRLVKLGPADFREMPWKNGAGCTTELAIEPPAATLAGGFLWRLSIASVLESGPFSRFPGFDRTLLLLDGNGMELDHGGHGRVLLPGPLVPAAFQGDWATSGRLLDGSCRDFNVMTQRGLALHDLLIIRPGSLDSLLPQAPTVLVFCAQGEASVAGLAGGLQAGELLRIDSDGGAGGVAAALAGGETVLVVVSIWLASCGRQGARCDLS